VGLSIIAFPAVVAERHAERSDVPASNERPYRADNHDGMALDADRLDVATNLPSVLGEAAKQTTNEADAHRPP
jgi:hypothetical protein